MANEFHIRVIKSEDSDQLLTEYIALFRKGQDLTSKDRGFRYGEYYKSHAHRGFRDLGIKGFSDFGI